MSILGIVNDDVLKVSVKYINNYEEYEEYDILGNIVEIDKQIIYASEHILDRLMESIEEQYNGLGKNIHNEVQTGITYLNTKAIYNSYLIFTEKKLFIFRFDENFIPLDSNEILIEIKNDNKKFWQKDKWLELCKKQNIDVYNKIINASNIEFDYNNFSLIIDGESHHLGFFSTNNC